MRFRDAIDVFDRHNAAGSVLPAAEDGTLRMMSIATRNGLISRVRAGLKRASGVRDNAVLHELEMRPYLEVLSEMAHAYAVENGKQRPSNYRAAVNTFLRIVEGIAPHDRIYKRRTSPHAFLPAWRPLYEALASKEAALGSNGRKYSGFLEALQTLALRNGVNDPAGLPDHAIVSGWAMAAGLGNDDRTNMFTAFRSARDASGRLELPPLEPPAPAAHRGVQTLPGLNELIASCIPRLESKHEALRTRGRAPKPLAPLGAPIASTDILTLLSYVAPEMAEAARMWLKHTATVDLKSTDWRETAVHALSAIVAELYRLGPTKRPDGSDRPEDPFTLDCRHLFTEMRLVPAKTVALAAEFSLDALDEVTSIEYDAVPLIRLVTDAMARRAIAHSPISVSEEQAQTDVPFYPATIFNQTSALWQVSTYVYGDALDWKEKRPAEWRTMNGSYNDLRTQMKATNATREMHGHIDKGLLTLNWGQAVCVGVATLWRVARERRAYWHQLEEKHALILAGDGLPARPEHRAQAATVRSVQAARARYHDALRDWAIAAVILDDGMRIKNYANGRLHRNFRPELQREQPGGPVVLDERGRPRLAGMNVSFKGFDREAGTKMRKKATGRERERTRSLKPGVVDLELLGDFLFDLRPADLVKSGKLAREEDYRLEDDTWAFFSQPRSTRDHSGFDNARLSKRFGKLIHWMHRDLLHLPDAEKRELPAWDELMAATPEGKTLRGRYRGLFNEHMVRTLLATFVIGVHSDHVEVQHRTNDTRDVLDDFYANFAHAISEAKKEQGMRNPEWFMEVTKHLLAGRVIDWTTFDPEHPETARVVAAPSAIVAPMSAQRRQRKRKAALNERMPMVPLLPHVSDGKDSGQDCLTAPDPTPARTRGTSRR